MKKIYFILLFFTITTNGHSWDSTNTEREIKKADKFIDYIDNNFEIRQHIPYDFYSEAIIDIRNSRKELNNEEFEIAYFYATIATIKLQTAEVIARTRSIKAKKIEKERNYYKKTVELKKFEVNLKSIIDANLLKVGNVYRIELIDKKIFSKKKLVFNKNGKNSVNNIIKVLEYFQRSKIKIVGHTSFNDLKKFSRFKSRYIAKYLIKNGIDSSRVEYLGAGNKIVMDTPIGYRRIDRVELIIWGI